MTSPLRRIAVHVDEPTAGAFEWVLSDIDASDQLHPIERAEAGCGSYHEAMALGLRALQARIDDLDAGPRLDRAAIGEATLQKPPKPPKPSARRHAPAPAPDKVTAFGFGLPH